MNRTSKDCFEWQRRAFTLLELLVVISVVAILAGLLLPSLGQAKARAQAVKCRSNLHQVGLALQIYIGDNRDIYPQLLNDDSDGRVWTDKVASNLSIANANDTGFTCPAFRAVVNSWRSGEFFFEGPGYAYNDLGTGWLTYPEQARLGLGFSPRSFLDGPETPPLAQSEVRAPSQMFAVTDSFYVPWEKVHPGWNAHATSGLIETFPFVNRTNRPRQTWDGNDFFQIQSPPQHGSDFNMLWCDGHVSPNKVADLFSVRRTAANWNNDNQDHPETW
jgi:prepilin-type N-terminal cleavage/methylation domain-containing protein/prepilin-type processing-associated H-X9-DG protein